MAKKIHPITVKKNKSNVVVRELIRKYHYLALCMHLLKML
jgi:hypothetical protein